MEHLAPAIAMVAFVVAVGWIVRISLNHKRLQKAASLQAEIHNRLLDKFESTQEVVSYLESEAGRRLLEAPRERAEPYGRVLGSVQAGLVATAVGMAVLVFRFYVDDPEGSWLFLGAVTLAIGIGFLLSAVASLALSKRFGLLDGGPTARGVE